MGEEDFDEDLNFDALLGFISAAKAKTIKEQDVTEALKVFDKDGNGFISAAELRRTFARAKGVGPKLATRIATELKDKAPPQGRCFSIGLAPHAPETASGGTAPRKPETPAGGASREDAVSALTNLGYHESLARQAVATVLRDKGEDTPLNDVIRLSLKELAP